VGRKDFDDVSTALMAPRELPASTVPRFVLTITGGRDRGVTFTVDGAQPSRTFVGKGPVCQLRLTDPTVSRRHLALDVVPGGLRASDLGSTNGSHVNGVAIIEVLLRGGELVRLGDTVIRVDAVEPARAPMSHASAFGRVVGASAAMRRLYPLCERLAASDVPLIIEGETGTGKELLAESLHEAGPRARGPFVVLDCTAVPPGLVESALFGHEAGAVPGAATAARGVFEQAAGGTLLIDEIGDLDVTIQPKLLRAIERSEVRRVGSERSIRVDVRLVATTRRDLDREIQAGRFRDDLFYRLAVARIELPPLRDRQGDVALLAQTFWKQLGGGDTPIPYDFMLRLEDGTWPGTVRELHNAITRRIALGDFEDAGPLAASGPPDAGRAQSAGGEDVIDRVLALDLPLTPSRDRVVDDFERRYVQRVLARHGGDIARAAAASGIARRYFQLLRARQARPKGDG
jgi:DNA-binding NtrC family response regulator